MTDMETGRQPGGGGSQVGEDAAKARAELEREAASARESLAEARQMAEERARSFMDDAAGQARAYADGQKEQAAQSLKDFAEAVRRASDELGSRDQTIAARFVQEAAGGLESLSQSVGARSIDGMLDTLRDFGRSNPTAFIAGSVLAGVAIGRFARSSNERDYQRYEHYFAGTSQGGRPSQPSQPRAGAPRPGGSSPTGSAAVSPAGQQQGR